MDPTPEQSTIIAAMGSSPSNLIVNAYAGCIAAGTNIRTRRGNDPTVRNIPIERLLHQRKPEIPTFVQCDIDGRADYLQMLGCFYKGLQETIRV
ncbi:MAG: hypothetical protein KGL39_58200, partial [Patescibacteria group bacterium]|nr:hypothetical protein [Patescibacteria group bacterium]